MPKQLKVKDKVKDTNKNPLPLEEEQKEVDIKPTKEEEKTLGFIARRFSDMQTQRSLDDKDWDIYQIQFEARHRFYKDGRFSSNVPLEYAVVEQYVSEANARKTLFKFDALTAQELPKVERFRTVWDYDWLNEDRDNEIDDNEYLTAIFWISYIFNGFETKDHIISDPLPDLWEDWEILFEKKFRRQSKIILKNLDVRNVYVDDRATKIEDAVDCIIVELISPEEFKAFRFNKNFKNFDQVANSSNDDFKVYFNKDETGFTDTKKIKLKHYFNIESDRYIVTANDAVIIRDQPNPFAHKQLPVTPRVFSKNPNSINGRWLCQILTSFKSQINNLKEMIMEGIKRSNNPTLLMGDWMDFDWEWFGYRNEILKVTGDLTNQFREITWQAPNQAIFNFFQESFREVAIYTWLDVSSIIWQPNKTAFEVAVQQESSLKRVNNVLRNRDRAFSRVAKLHAKNLMQFFPIKQVRELAPLNADWSIPDMSTLPLAFPQVPWEKQIEWSKETEKTMFTIKPEDIRTQMDIRVETNFNTPTLKELERENFKDFTTYTAELIAATQISPELWEILPVDKLVKEAAFKFNVDIEWIWKSWEEASKEKQKIFGALEKLRAWITGEQPVEWEEELEPKWLRLPSPEVATSNKKVQTSIPNNPLLSNINSRA